MVYTKERNQLTQAEVRTWSGFVGLFGGLTLTSEPLWQQEWVGTERNYAILVPPVPERGRAIDGTDPLHRLFGFTARRPWGDFSVVQVWNPQATAATVDLDLGRFHDGPCHVWSFWDARYLGVHAGRATLPELPPHGSAVLRLTPATPGLPAVVGSDLHLGCGAAEITAQAATPGRIEIGLRPVGQASGSLWVSWGDRLQQVPVQPGAQRVVAERQPAAAGSMGRG